MKKRPKKRKIQPWASVKPERVTVKPWPSDSYPECKWWVEPVEPRKRDFWKVLRGKYQPTLRVGRNTNLRYMNDTLTETWCEPTLAEELYARSPLLDAIEGAKK